MGLLRLAVAAVLAALVLSRCGGGGEDADKVLAETAERLAQIRSGDLDVVLTVDPKGADDDEFGFELHGPFALGRKGSLPTMRVAYTQLADGRRGTVTLLSTGREAFVLVGGRAYALPPEQVEELRGATGALGGSRGLGQLRIDDWIGDAEVSDGGEIGGAETDRVRAKLKVGNAVNDLLSLARRSGGAGLERIAGADAEQLRRAARSGTFEVYTGKDDRLLRRLTIEVDFGLDVPQVLQEALGGVVGARVRFELGIANPNRPVRVARPEAPRPYSELVPGS